VLKYRRGMDLKLASLEGERGFSVLFFGGDLNEMEGR